MLSKNKFKMFIRRVEPMSEAGFDRLNRKARLNFIKEVYKPLETVIINTDKVYDENTLAYFLIFKFGAGKYDGLGWDSKRHKFKKQLFKALIHGNMDSKWGYEFLAVRGIARMGWWIGEF